MKNTLLYFLTLIFLASCGQNETKETETSISEYSITKIDSFEVNNLTRVFIRDYSAELDRYFGYAMVEDDLLEISGEGEIIRRTHKKGDGPGLYGNWNPIGISFGPEQERIVELPFQILSYDSTYSVIHSQRIQSPLPIRTFGPMGRTEYFQNSDSTFYLVGPSNYLSSHYLIQNEEGRDTLKNFYKIHIQSGDMKSIIPYRESSPYRQTDNIYQELMTKSFLVDHEKQELLILHALSKEIEVYNLPALDFSRSIPITHSEFVEYSPVPLGTMGNDDRIKPLRFMAGRNQNLIKVDSDTYLIKYFSGVSEAEYETRIANDATYLPSSDPEEQAILIIKNGKQVSQELSGIAGSILFGLGDGKFLVQEPENQEVEEEKTRFSIYQIKSS